MQENASLLYENRQFGNKTHCNSSCETFAGIPATRSKAGALLRLNHAPEPLVRIGLQLSGALFGDSIYLEKNAIQRVAVPVLSQVAKMLREFGVGASYSTLRISEDDSEILVLGTNLRAKSERERFATEFDCSIGRVSCELKLIAQLAGMPAGEFSKAWFADGIHPDQEFLPALRIILDLNRVLNRCGAILTVDGRAIHLPEFGVRKTIKQAGVFSDVVGELTGIQAHPGTVMVQMHERAKTIALRAVGNGYVDQLNREFRLGDTVRVSFEPVVDMLRPFETLPSKGRLVDIVAA